MYDIEVKEIVEKLQKLADPNELKKYPQEEIEYFQKVIEKCLNEI
ncbi:MAG: hypothetical protein QXF15_00260 [Candidatus Aenigmatarchaeota archaeon]